MQNLENRLLRFFKVKNLEIGQKLGWLVDIRASAPREKTKLIDIYLRSCRDLALGRRSSPASYPSGLCQTCVGLGQPSGLAMPVAKTDSC